MRTPAATAPAGAADTARPLLADPTYRLLWLTGLLYYHVYMGEIVVTGWAVLRLTGSALDVGLAGFSRMLPMLILGLIFGALADRFRGTTVLLLVQGGGALASAALAILFALGRAQLWQVCLAALALGCCWTADFSARRALIAQLQPPDRLSNAMSLETVSMLGSKIAATALGGVLLALGGPGLAYAWQAAVFCAGIVLVATLARRGRIPRQPPPAGIAVLRLVREGWAASVRVPIVRGVLLVTVVMNALVFPYQQIIAVIADQILHVGAVPMGVLAGSDGLGAIVVAGYLSTAARPLRQGPIFLAGATLACALIAALALSPLYPLSLAVQVLLGACMGAFGSLQPALIIGAMAPELRARAMGVLAMAIGVNPAGILLSGALSSAIGPSTTLVALGLAALALNLMIAATNRTLLRGGAGAGEPAPAATGTATAREVRR